MLTGFLRFQNGIIENKNTGKCEHVEHISQLAQGS